MKTAMLLSGGVDSSIALHILKDQGHDVTAFYLKIWLEDELSSLGECPWEEDLRFVKTTCHQLNVPLEIISLQQIYHEKIITTMLQQIQQGLTPNPDILCNQWIKFGAFYDQCGYEFSHIATGHYAQVEHGQSCSYLCQALDAFKDQTYFLALLQQHQLSRALFPIGHLLKHQVRSLAHEYRLPTATRKDSQGICFLGKIPFDQFLEYHLGTRPGNFIEYETGTIMGQHKGFWFYTIGQRQKIGLSGGPWFVVTKNPDENSVFISRHYHALSNLRTSCTVPSFNWIADHNDPPQEVLVKTRHGEKMHAATITRHSSGNGIDIHLHEADQGIASGQFAVVYHDGRCLGGGSMVQKIPYERKYV